MSSKRCVFPGSYINLETVDRPKKKTNPVRNDAHKCQAPNQEKYDEIRIVEGSIKLHTTLMGSPKYSPGKT